MPLLLRRVASLTTLAFLLALPLRGQSFQGLGDLPGGGFNSAAAGVSGDGAVVVGSGNSSFPLEAFRWTAADRMQGLGTSRSSAAGVSSDGSVIVGSFSSSSGEEGFRWENGSMQGLGFLGGGTSPTSSALDVSSDGRVVVGRSEYMISPDDSEVQAFRWEGGVMQGLGDLPGGDFRSEATGVSADGSVIAGNGAYLLANGNGGTQAFRWTAADGMMALPFLPGGEGSICIAHGISADGSVIVGTSIASGAGGLVYEAARWKDGRVFGLGHLPNSPGFSRADAASGDGSVIVGDGGSGEGAFIWTEERGMQNLVQMLRHLGLDLSGWTLSHATGVSYDGTVVVGYGINPRGETEAWRAVLVPTFAVTAPAEDEIVEPGTTYTVRFSAPDVPNAIHLYLVRTFDPAGPRELLAENVPAADGRFEWEVPEDLLSPSTFIVAVDADDPSREVRTERFRVRTRWRLHRVVGSVAEPEYEPIRLARNAWSFSQDEEIMWPESYWGPQYHWYGNTRVGYDPFVEPLPQVRYDIEYFAGHSNSEHPAWPAMVRAFGISGTYASLEPQEFRDVMFNQPNPTAAAFWDFKTRQFGGYQGVCYGMSMAMMAAFQNPSAFDAKWLQSGGSETIADLAATDEVRDAIHALFLYQYGRIQQSKSRSDQATDPRTPRDVLEDLKNMFERDARDLDRVLLFSSSMNETDADGNQEFGSHAVVPLGMDRVDDGIYAVGVFDPNYGPPGSGGEENPAFVTIDSTRNAWTHSNPIWVGATERGLYLSIDVIYAFDPASTTWPHVYGGNEAAGKASSVATTTVQPRVSIVGRAGAVTSEAGELRYEEGVLTETLPGGYVSFPFTGLPSRPDAYVVPAGAAYQAEAVPDARGIAQVQVEGGRIEASFLQGAATSDTRAVVDLLPDGIAVVSSGEGTFELSARAHVGAAEVRTARAAGINRAGGLNEPAGLRLTATADTAAFRFGGAAQDVIYQLTLGRTVPGGSRAFYHADVPLAAGATHTVRPDWGALGEGSITIEVDDDGDGEEDETLVLENEGLPVRAEPPASVTIGALELGIYPNPTGGVATAALAVDHRDDVRLEVFDVLGRRVALLHYGPLAAGAHAFTIDGGALPAGVYLVRAATTTSTAVRYFTLVR